MSLTQGDFDDLITAVPKYLHTVQQNSGTLVDNAGDILDLLPDSLGAQVKQLLARLHAVTRKLIALLAKPVTEPGDPFALLTAGAVWVTGVGERADGQVPVIDNARLDGWTGAAPVRYAMIRTAQATAVAAVSKLTEPLHAVLTSVGNAIITMWVGVAAAFRAVTPELAGAASAAGSIVTLPAAAATAANALRWLVPVTTAVLAAAHTRLTAATCDLARLGQPDAYHWPPVRRSIADPADWRPAPE